MSTSKSSFENPHLKPLQKESQKSPAKQKSSVAPPCWCHFPVCTADPGLFFFLSFPFSHHEFFSEAASQTYPQSSQCCSIKGWTIERERSAKPTSGVLGGPGRGVPHLNWLVLSKFFLKSEIEELTEGIFQFSVTLSATSMQARHTQLQCLKKNHCKKPF